MYIVRKNEILLKEWHKRDHKKPLIIRGARQTGKTCMIEQFGRQNYSHMVVINFDKEPELKLMFKRRKPIEIVRELEVIKNIPIASQKTLLFIDEIQDCPEAIKKLRYFYEDLPDYHVIAAGSLLEFVLERKKISFPVGRVEFQYLYPLSFEEYLGGCHETGLLKILKEIRPHENISVNIHERLRQLLGEYLLIGGMPEVQTLFFETRRYRDADFIKESILETYRDDFKKYYKRVNVDNLDLIFRVAPKWIGKRLNLSKMHPGQLKSREAGVAINLLQRAMILFRVECSKDVSFPLTPHVKTQPKLIFLDLGLVQYVNRISQEIILGENYHCAYKGAFAEQLVGQELLSVLGSLHRPELFHWQRKDSTSMAEVDYLFPFKSHILPLEVKAGFGSSLFSLHQFMFRNKCPLALRVYDGPLDLREIRIAQPQIKYKLLSIPLYMIAQTQRLVNEVI